MNEFKRAREEYESTPIPEELDARVHELMCAEYKRIKGHDET